MKSAAMVATLGAYTAADYTFAPDYVAPESFTIDDNGDFVLGSLFGAGLHKVTSSGQYAGFALPDSVFTNPADGSPVGYTGVYSKGGNTYVGAGFSGLVLKYSDDASLTVAASLNEYKNLEQSYTAINDLVVVEDETKKDETIYATVSSEDIVVEVKNFQTRIVAQSPAFWTPNPIDGNFTGNALKLSVSGIDKYSDEHLIVGAAARFGAPCLFRVGIDSGDVVPVDFGDDELWPSVVGIDGLRIVTSTKTKRKGYQTSEIVAAAYVLNFVDFSVDVKIMKFRSHDGWKTATVVGTVENANADEGVFVSVATHDGDVWALSSNINRLARAFITKVEFEDEPSAKDTWKQYVKDTWKQYVIGGTCAAFAGLSGAAFFAYSRKKRSAAAASEANISAVESEMEDIPDMVSNPAIIASAGVV